MSITLAEAVKVIDAATRKAAELGIRVSVAVIDEGAHLVALHRMDGAMPVSPQVAEGKAVGAAMFRRDGAAMLSMANDRQAFYAAVSGMARTRMVPGPGSLLIQRDGATLGAVGVSGGSPAQDLECAEAGTTALT
jgi:glc operon protein GlcG